MWKRELYPRVSLVVRVKETIEVLWDRELSSTCYTLSVESGYGWMVRKCLPNKKGPWSSLLLQSMLTCGKRSFQLVRRIQLLCMRTDMRVHQLKEGRHSRSVVKSMGHINKGNNVKVLFSIYSVMRMSHEIFGTY